MADGSATSSTRAALLVRHADTAANDTTAGPEIERGWKPYPLDGEGRKEARRLAVKLARLGVKELVSSDLPRAKQTAKIIGDWLGIEPEFYSQLRTWNTGEFAGKPCKETEPQLVKLVRFSPDRVIPGGESFEQFERRIFAALSDILATHLRDPLAIIIHGRIERLIASWEAAGAKRDHAISVDTFLAKPEQPGHIEKWDVDPASLRLSHAEADYGQAKPKGDRCEICKAYRGPDKCTKVRQPISPDGWCAVGVSKTDGHAFAK